MLRKKNTLQREQLLSEERGCFIKSKDTHTSDVNYFCLAEGDISNGLEKGSLQNVILSKPYCHGYAHYSVSTCELSLKDNIVFKYQCFSPPCEVLFKILSSQDNQEDLIIMLTHCKH